MAASPDPLRPDAPVVAVQPAAALQAYLAPSRDVMQELRTGLRKLQRVCGAGANKMPAMDAGLAPETQIDKAMGLRDEWARSRIVLDLTRDRTRAVLQRFEQNSALGQQGWCRFAPALLPVCSAYKHDQQLLGVAQQVLQQLIGEAQLRLQLYQQYAELEATQCTRSGFTQRLWRTEETLLWPLVTGAPEFFTQTLLPKGP